MGWGAFTVHRGLMRRLSCSLLVWLFIVLAQDAWSWVIYAQHPWSGEAARAGQPLFLFGTLTGTAILATNQMAEDPDHPGWWKLEVPEQTAAAADYFQIVNYKTPASKSGKTTFSTKFYFATLFAASNEAWIAVADGKATVTATRPVQWQTRNLYFVSPWESGGVTLFYGDSTVAMQSIDTTYCGWFKAALTLADTQTSVLVSMSQSGGTGVFGNKGLGDLDPIALDLTADSADMWLRVAPYPSGTAVVGADYGKTLGACRHTLLRASVWDWSKTSNPAFAGKPTTCKSGGDVPMENAVLPVLGSDGKPQYAGDNSCYHENVADWYKTVAVTGSTSGNPYTNQRCIDLPLSKDENDFFRYETNLFFVVDNWQYMSEGLSDVNPNYSLETAKIDGKKHNFLFTMELGAEFVYVPGQTFTFRGDDDVWVYINDTLAVDIGGIHGEVERTVNLDTLGLTAGETYPFQLFYAERNCCSSNFKMITSIDLKVQSAVTLKKETLGEQKNRYTVLQTLTTEGSSCEMAPVVGTPQPAEASFVLTGTGLATAQTLKAGLHFGGIEIFADETGFVIDIAAIVGGTALPPGTYQIKYALRSDASQQGIVKFIVPEYEAAEPELRLLRSDSTVLALGDTLKTYKGGTVQILVEALQDGKHCDACSYSLVLKGRAGLELLPDGKSAGTTLDMVKGWALLGIRGIAETKDGAVEIQGPLDSLYAKAAPIIITDPGLPVVTRSFLWDDNGDGRADRLEMTFDRELKTKPNSLVLHWPADDSSGHVLNLAQAKQNKLSYTWSDSLFSKEVRTAGTGTLDWTYAMADGAEFTGSAEVVERIGAIVLKASLDGDAQSQTLKVLLSEGLRPDWLDSLLDSAGEEKFIAELFAFELPDGDQNLVIQYVSWNDEASEFRLSSIKNMGRIPRPNDKIRLVPEGNGFDRRGNAPHVNNPWVKITGVADASIESNDFANVDDQGYTEEGTEEIFIPAGPTIKEIAQETGRPGYLLDLDLQQYLSGDSIKPEDVEVEWNFYIYNNTGSFVRQTSGRYSCADEGFDGNCAKSDPKRIYLAWDMHSEKGRKVASGVYIVQMNYNIKVLGNIVVQDKHRKLWGVMR
jgi:fibro-slime domain-containing protein